MNDVTAALGLDGELARVDPAQRELAEPEISVPLAENIASWRRIAANRNPAADKREMLRHAKDDLLRTLEIDRTSHPGHSAAGKQAVFDTLHDIAEYELGIPTDEAQGIFAERPSKNGHEHSEEPIETNGGNQPPDDGWQSSTEIPDNAATDAGANETQLTKQVRRVFTLASQLQGHTVPRRRWLVRDRIPMRAVTILSGDGASGKTTILLQLADAVLCGTDWLGAVIDEPGPAMFITAEEDDDEIHRRLSGINEHTGHGFADLGALRFLCLPGEDALLGVVGRDGQIRPSPLFEQIEAEAKRVQPKLIGIEAAADVFGGDENNRGQVRQFVQLLRRLSFAADAAVVLIQHPSVSGLQEGQGRSGSTAWRNSARSQLYFASPKRTDGEAEGDIRELRRVKSNYSATGEVVQVRWQRGVFVPVSAPTSIERIAAEAEVDTTFLRLLEQVTAQGRQVGPSASKNFAPSIFEEMPDARGVKSLAFAQSMERLFAAGRIQVATSGPPSRQRSRLVATSGVR